MPSHDTLGREYAKLVELNEGDMVWVDEGFTCMPPGPYRVYYALGGLYLKCTHGYHFLNGQADDGVHCIGIYPTDPKVGN